MIELLLAAVLVVPFGQGIEQYEPNDGDCLTYIDGSRYAYEPCLMMVDHWVAPIKAMKTLKEHGMTRALLKYVAPDEVYIPPPPPGGFGMLGSCDSDQDCWEATDPMCREAGYGGAVLELVVRHVAQDGSGTVLCEGPCMSGDVSAYVLCSPDTGDDEEGDVP